jgi:quercetin dioxygenase-like cupin family protein
MPHHHLKDRLMRPFRLPIPPTRYAAALFGCCAMLTFSVESFAGSPAPTDTTGTTVKQLGEIDLAGEMDAVKGHKFRARLVTINPGGHLGVHSHAGRPTLEYVVQGNVIEVRNGVEIPHKAGDIVVAPHDVTHWWENKGSVPAVLLPVDIYKQSQ